MVVRAVAHCAVRSARELKMSARRKRERRKTQATRRGDERREGRSTEREARADDTGGERRASDLHDVVTASDASKGRRRLSHKPRWEGERT